MGLSKNEKEYLAALVHKEAAHFKKEQKLLTEVSVSFLKAEHDLGHFFDNLLRKLEG